MVNQLNNTPLKASMIQQGTISRQLGPASLRLCGAQRSVSRNILSSHQSLLEPKVGYRSVELQDSVAVKMQTIADAPLSQIPGCKVQDVFSVFLASLHPSRVGDEFKNSDKMGKYFFEVIAWAS